MTYMTCQSASRDRLPGVKLLKLWSFWKPPSTAPYAGSLCKALQIVGKWASWPSDSPDPEPLACYHKQAEDPQHWLNIDLTSWISAFVLQYLFDYVWLSDFWQSPGGEPSWVRNFKAFFASYAATKPPWSATSFVAGLSRKLCPKTCKDSPKIFFVCRSWPAHLKHQNVSFSPAWKRRNAPPQNDPSKYCQFISKTSAGASQMHFKILQSKTSRSGRDGTDEKIRGKKDQKGSFCHVLAKNRAAPILGESRKQQAALPSDWPLNHHLTRCRLQSAHEWFMIFSRFHLSNLFSNKYPELIPTAATASGTSLQNLRSLKMSSRKAPLTLASLVDQGSIEYSNCCLCLAGPADIVLQYLVGAEFVTRKYCFYLCIINAYIWHMFIWYLYNVYKIINNICI